MSIFWRITPRTSDAPVISGSGTLKREGKLLSRLCAGHALVLAHWLPGSCSGRAQAIGIVQEVDRTAGNITVFWKLCGVEFHPSPTGRQQWAKEQDWFKFDPPVAKRYGLEKLLQKAFPDLDGIKMRRTSKRNREVGERGVAPATPGYVYVIRSDHGFKIGKAIDVRSRTRLFGVKLPFETTIEHYAHFADYSKAEKNLHKLFNHKRLQGEWFDLDANDLAVIRTMGKSVDISGL